MSRILITPEDDIVKQERENDILDPKCEISTLEDIIKTEDICSDDQKFHLDSNEGVKLERVTAKTNVLKKEQGNDDLLDTKYEISYLEDNIKTEDEKFRLGNESAKLESSSSEGVATNTDVLKKERENDLLDTKYEIYHLEDSVKTEDEKFQLDNEILKMESSSSECVTADIDVLKMEQENDQPDTEYEMNYFEDDLKREDVCGEDKKFQLDNESVKLESSSSESDTDKVKRGPKPKILNRKLAIRCDKCNETVPSRSRYVRHCSERHDMQIKEIKSYVCQLCPSRFVYSSSLYRHIKDHTGVTCDQCNKSFTSSGGKWAHKLLVHTDRKKWKHLCKICNKRYAIKSIHNKHMKLHTDVKRFECLMCQKRFMDSWGLGQHMNIHSNVKEFKCSCCEKEYKNKRDLKIHMAKVHSIGVGDVKLPSEERSFICDLCPKTYCSQNHLRRHFYTHSSEKPFACTICDKKFNYKDYLKQHMRKKHDNEPESLE